MLRGGRGARGNSWSMGVHGKRHRQPPVHRRGKRRVHTGCLDGGLDPDPDRDESIVEQERDSTSDFRAVLDGAGRGLGIGREGFFSRASCQVWGVGC